MPNRGEEFAVAIEYKGEGVNDLVPKEDMPLLKDAESYDISRREQGQSAGLRMFAYN